MKKISMISIFLALALVVSAQFPHDTPKQEGVFARLGHWITGHATHKDAFDEIVSIYAKAGDQARGQLSNLKHRDEDSLLQTREDIARIYDKAADDAETDIQKLRDKAARLHAGTDQEKTYLKSLHDATSQIGGLFREQLMQARAKIQHLEKRADESWDSFKQRVADIYDQSAQATKDKLKQIKNGAVTAAQKTKETVIDKPSQFVGDTVGQAKDKVSSMVGAGARSYEDHKDRIAAIWRNAMTQAADSARSLRSSGTESWDDMQSKVMNVYHKALGNAENQVNSLLSSAGDWTQGAYDTAAHGAQALGSKAADSIRSVIPGRGYNERLQGLKEHSGESWLDLKKRVAGIFDELERDDARRIEELRAELEQAEKRHNAHKHAKEEVEGMPDVPGASFEDRKKAISDVFARSENPGMFARTWQSVKDRVAGVFNHRSPDHTKTISDTYKEAAETAKEKANQLTSVSSETFDNAKARIAKVFDDAIANADASVDRLRHKKDALTPEEERQLQVAETYKASAQTAKDKVSQLMKSPGATFESTRDQIAELYGSVWRAENILPSAAETWSTVKNAATGLWETTKRALKTDVPATYRSSIATAHTRLGRMEEIPGETWSSQRQRVAEMYKEALVDAESRLVGLQKRFHDAKAMNKDIAPEDRAQFKILQLYQKELEKAIATATSLKHISADTFADTKKRVARIFHDELDTLENRADSIAHSDQKWTEKLKHNMATLYHSAASKLGLGGKHTGQEEL